MIRLSPIGFDEFENELLGDVLSAFGLKLIKFDKYMTVHGLRSELLHCVPNWDKLK